MRPFLLFLAWAAAACAHSSAPTVEHASSKAECCDSDGCPMRQNGMQVVYEDTEEGAMMVFTADDVAALQGRVAKMAQMHSERASHEGAPAHTVRSDNTPSGARLSVTPADPSQLEALRTHVRSNVEKMQRGKCPMKCCQRGEG